MAQAKKKTNKKKVEALRLRKFNNFLRIVVFVFALYLIIWPFLPKFEFWWKSLTHSDPPLVKVVKSNKPNEVIPNDNTIVIPSIHLQKTIYDGLPYPSLAKGVWHSSRSSTPDRGSNTVMAGHRFTYNGFQRGASTFYDLDKVKQGDDIVVYWQNKRYNYKVTNTLVVSPSQVSIENPTSQPELTLYTCTPLWTSISRLVVQARLVSS
jgi:LPXTG-site transpeptidase (sortase) family protein